MSVITQTQPTLDIPLLDDEPWHQISHAQLDKSYQLSARLNFDSESKIVMFSDCHRGTKDRYDAFAANESLYLTVLKHYFERDFTFIEVGDGDELWHNRRFHDIQQAYQPLFDLFAQFKKKNRLHLIVGNHESLKGLFDPMVKEGTPLHQGLILQHQQTRQSLFVVHGHQVNPKGDHLWWFKRPHSRYFWKYFLPLGFDKWYHVSEPQPGLPRPHRLERIPLALSDWILNKAKRLETAVKRWIHLRQQPLICGHFHMCALPDPGQTPYFNTGQCLSPGYITGLEIEGGHLSLIKWKFNQKQIKRQLLKQIAFTQLPFASHEKTL